MPPRSSQRTAVVQRRSVPPKPAKPVTAFSSDAGYISFRHPGQPLDQGPNKILELPAFDNGGLHVGTALIACGIIAGNRWDGWLTKELGGEPLDCDSDAILTDPSYYFHLPRPEDASDSWRYSIYPSFRHWVFPHNNLPPTWLPRPDATTDQDYLRHPPNSVDGVGHCSESKLPSDQLVRYRAVSLPLSRKRKPLVQVQRYGRVQP